MTFPLSPRSAMSTCKDVYQQKCVGGMSGSVSPSNTLGANRTPVRELHQSLRQKVALHAKQKDLAYCIMAHVNKDAY